MSMPFSQHRSSLIGLASVPQYHSFPGYVCRVLREMEQTDVLRFTRSVKSLVDEGLAGLPERFIRPVEQRPAGAFADHLITFSADIPIIDLAQEFATVVEAVGRACCEWGCFQVVNHGIHESTMHEMMHAAREFFAQPEEEKTIYFTADTSAKVRYTCSFNSDKDKILSWRDFIRYACHPLDEVVPLWPANPPSFRKASINYCTEIHEVVKKLSSAISVSLGLSESYIEDQFPDYSQVMVCNYYPACPDPNSTLGVGSHTDPGWITALMQDTVGGLEVLHDGHWVLAKPIPDALVVNLGDVLQILSNGKYKSVEHRAVVNSNSDRISVVTTYGPSLKSVIRPACQLVDASHPAVYRECLYEDYMGRILGGALDDKRLVDFHALQIVE